MLYVLQHGEPKKSSSVGVRQATKHRERLADHQRKSKQGTTVEHGRDTHLLDSLAYLSPCLPKNCTRDDNTSGSVEGSHQTGRCVIKFPTRFTAADELAPAGRTIPAGVDGGEFGI